MLHYNLTDYSDTLSFLNLLARRMGKLRKGGVPDINQAARALLQDWNRWFSFTNTAPTPAVGVIESFAKNLQRLSNWAGDSFYIVNCISLSKKYFNWTFVISNLFIMVKQVHREYQKDGKH